MRGGGNVMGDGVGLLMDLMDLMWDSTEIGWMVLSVYG